MYVKRQVELVFIFTYYFTLFFIFDLDFLNLFVCIEGNDETRYFVGYCDFWLW